MTGLLISDANSCQADQGSSDVQGYPGARRQAQSSRGVNVQAVAPAAQLADRARERNRVEYREGKLS